MSAEIIKLRERAKGLLTVRFGRPFVSLLLAPKHTTNSSLPKLMPQYVDALQKTTNLARMQELADAAETLRDRSKDPDTILASVLAVKKSVVSASFGNLLGRKKKAKGTPKGTPKKNQKPPPSPKTTAKDNATIIALEKKAKDCKEELQQVEKKLNDSKTKLAQVEANKRVTEKEFTDQINGLKTEKKTLEQKMKEAVEQAKKDCNTEIENLQKNKTTEQTKAVEAVEKRKDAEIRKIKGDFEAEKKGLQEKIDILEKAQTESQNRETETEKNLKLRVAALEKIEGILKSKKETLEQELSKLRTANSKLEESNRTLQSQKKALETAKTKLEESNRTLKGQNNKLNTEKGTLEGRTDKLKETNKSLKKTNKNLEASLEQIRARLELSQKEKAALEREVLTLKSDESSSNKVKRLERDLKQAQREEKRHKDNLTKQQEVWATTKTLLNRQYGELIKKYNELDQKNKKLKAKLTKKNQTSSSSPSSGSGRSTSNLFSSAVKPILSNSNVNSHIGEVVKKGNDGKRYVVVSGKDKDSFEAYGITDEGEKSGNKTTLKYGESYEVTSEKPPLNFSFPDLTNRYLNSAKQNNYALIVERNDDKKRFLTLSITDKAWTAKEINGDEEIQELRKDLKRFTVIGSIKQLFVESGSVKSGREDSDLTIVEVTQDDDVSFSEELVPALPKIHIPSREEMD